MPAVQTPENALREGDPIVQLATLNSQPPERPVHERDGSSLDVIDVWDTVQGEGPFAGTPAVFIRLAGCQLKCPGCDTDYTTGRTVRTVSEITDQVRALRAASYTRVGIRDGEPVALFSVPTLVVLTGGEPFRQPVGLLARELLALGYRIQVETNGAVFLADFPYLGDVTVVCSPKTPVVAEPLRRYVTALKYVLHHSAVSPEDGLPVTTLAAPCRVARPWHWFQGDIFVQPTDTKDPADNALSLAAVEASCRTHNYRISIQTHKLLGVA